MSNSEVMLSDVFSEECIKSFGKCFRYALWRDNDYASLIELENAESAPQFAEALRKFLRRYRSGGFMSEDLRKKTDTLRQQNRWEQLRRLLRQHEVGPRPSEGELERLMQLAASSQMVGLLRAAILSYALVKREPVEQVKGELT